MKISFDCNNLDKSFKSILPTLIKVIFHLQSLYYCFFIIMIRNSYNKQKVFFSQIVRLIKSTNYIKKINNFIIKPIKYYLFFIIGFSRHALSQLSFSTTILSTVAKISSILDDTSSTIL